MENLQQLVDRADIAALLRAVDGLCASREWDDLVDLARRCRDAIELGKQLWSVAMHIEYRLALEAPASYAAAVLRPGAARFALGPLTEVAASTHDWASLAPHLTNPATTAAVAAERVLRGEDLRGARDPALLAAPLELPGVLQPWEPAYALPRYRDRDAAFPEPEVATRPVPAPRRLRRGERIEDDAAVRALRDLVEVWVSQSAGTAQAVAVAGGADEAVAWLTEEAGLLEVEAAEALALLQWAGASGGAYGRRPGGAAGRFGTWWAAAALAGLDWPVDPDELGGAVGELRWFRWTPAAPAPGWTLRLAVADPVDGLAWAVEGLDRREDPDAVLRDAGTDPS